MERPTIYLDDTIRILTGLISMNDHRYQTYPLKCRGGCTLNENAAAARELRKALAEVKTQPIVGSFPDRVDVVRCENCVFHEEFKTKLWMVTPETAMKCARVDGAHFSVEPDWFCSRGRTREMLYGE